MARPRLIGLLLAGLAIAVHLTALRNPFVYDDRITVVENVSIRHPGNLHAMLYFNLFRPLANVSFAVDYRLWGLHPAGFHLTNIVLHAVNVALVFTLVSHLVHDTGGARPGAGVPFPGTGRLIAMATAVLFAVHPLMTEAVGYVSGRSDVLSATFFLLAVLAMRKGLVGGGRGWVVLAVLAAILAVASKEVAIMFPFVVLLYDRIILAPSGPAHRRRWLTLHLPLTGAVVLLGAARVAVFLFVEQTFSLTSLARMVRYLMLQFEVVWKYVQLLVLPLHQSIAHSATGFLALTVLGAVAVGLTCALAVRLRRRAPLVSFGIAWFLILLVPSSSILPLAYVMAEHRVYLASVGFFLLAAVAFARLAQGLNARGQRRAAYAAGLLVLATLSGLTLARTAVWADPVTLWRDAALKAPRWDTYMAFGNALRDADDCPAALVAYEFAARLDPDRLLPLAARWACLATMGRRAEAQAIVRHILRVDPRLTRICQEARALAPTTVSVASCVAEFRAAFGPAG